jgi:uncharacterized membrane protein
MSILKKISEIYSTTRLRHPAETNVQCRRSAQGIGIAIPHMYIASKHMAICALRMLVTHSFSRPKRIGLAIVFGWFLIGGIAHFAATDLEVRIVPPYIPSPRSAVLISGAFELVGALGLLVKSTRRAAGLGLFLLTVAVTPVHIYMLESPELFSVPYWALVLRLPLQAALLALIAWSTALCVTKLAAT